MQMEISKANPFMFVTPNPKTKPLRIKGRMMKPKVEEEQTKQPQRIVETTDSKPTFLSIRLRPTKTANPCVPIPSGEDFLTSLPLEILFQIISEIRFENDIYALRLTCKTFYMLLGGCYQGLLRSFYYRRFAGCPRLTARRLTLQDDILKIIVQALGSLEFKRLTFNQ
jgi:hypothetical protein